MSENLSKLWATVLKLWDKQGSYGVYKESLEDGALENQREKANISKNYQKSWLIWWILIENRATQTNNG